MRICTIQSHLVSKLASTEAMEDMHSPHIFVPTTATLRATRFLERYAGYGMGWQIWDYRGRPLLWHSGSDAGQKAYMALLPKDRLGVAVMVNSWRGPWVHVLIANRILDTYLGVASPDPIPEALRADSAARQRDRDERAQLERERIPDAKPSRPLDSYTGAYADSLFGPVEVRLEPEGLSLRMGEGLTADLLPWHYETFLVRWRSPRHREDWMTLGTFTLDAKAEPAGFSMVLGRDTVAVRRVAEHPSP